MSRARLVITAVVVEGRGVREVARDYGVSPGWVSRLVARYRDEGEAAFEPRSRRPHRSPRATPAETVELIIDLRRNGGGAFAVVPLVGHLIARPIDAGVFVVGSWYAGHTNPPGPADLVSAKPWRGYSVKAFQADVLTRPLTSYRIDPLKPRFRGPVIVLTSTRSISAAEIAADVLQSAGRAKIVGEKTPGIVLSSKLFDISGGFHLRVPIADFYSVRGGRLEGTGVTPDVPVAADQALEVALGFENP